jgi:hypothetical protein
MDFISTEMYQSLKAAGASEEDAKKGAAVLCELDTRLIKLEAEHRITRYLVGLNILLTFIFGFGILHILH